MVTRRAVATRRSKTMFTSPDSAGSR
jgi:hypothetical protein